jgi:hypothetical protein
MGSARNIDRGVATPIQIDSHDRSIVRSVWDEAFPQGHRHSRFDQPVILPIFTGCTNFAGLHSCQSFRTCSKAQELKELLEGRPFSGIVIWAGDSLLLSRCSLQCQL